MRGWLAGAAMSSVRALHAREAALDAAATHSQRVNSTPAGRSASSGARTWSTSRRRWWARSTSACRRSTRVSHRGCESWGPGSVLLQQRVCA